MGKTVSFCGDVFYALYFYKNIRIEYLTLAIRLEQYGIPNETVVDTRFRPLVPAVH